LTSTSYRLSEVGRTVTEVDGIERMEGWQFVVAVLDNDKQVPEI
jgi:hypothetical protein